MRDENKRHNKDGRREDEQIPNDFVVLEIVKQCFRAFKVKFSSACLVDRQLQELDWLKEDFEASCR